VKAIGYIRVSTEEQSADDKYGIEVQKQAISDYADRNDFEIVCWLTDTISGAKGNRPELDKILYNADQLPAHEAVIVFKNDRVARDTKLYFYYFYTLEKRNVKLLSTEEHFSEGDDFANIYRSLLRCGTGAKEHRSAYRAWAVSQGSMWWVFRRQQAVWLLLRRRYAHAEPGGTPYRGDGIPRA
jgi:predicted site-specific integrase-resolvase